MKISPSLYHLATLFPSPLYVVGGAVRDFLAGFGISDYDICASLTPTQVEALFCDPQSPIKVHKTSPKLGTLRIIFNDEYYEYTTFRSDSYGDSGAHAPNEVKFVTDIKTDALRRDFTVNAVYYDIVNDKFIDEVGGIADIKNHILRAVREPQVVFSEDALRILRLIRIAAETGFEIEAETFLKAKENAYRLGAIAKERIGEEFSKMIVADTINGIVGAHTRAIKLLIATTAIDYIVPELTAGIGFPQRPDYHLYDVYTHILKVYELCPPHLRLAGLFHDIAKPRVKMATGKMATHEVVSAEIATARLYKLRYPKDEIKRVSRLVACHMYDLDCQTSIKKLRLFIQKNHDIIDDLIILKNADYVGGGIMTGENPSAKRLQETYDSMQKEGVPFTLRELKINGKDVLAAKINSELCGYALERLLIACANNGELLTREAQCEFLQQLRRELTT